MTVVELATKLNHFPTIEEANRVIKGGGFKINSVNSTNPAEALIFGQHILMNNISVVKVGTYEHFLCKNIFKIILVN